MSQSFKAANTSRPEAPQPAAPKRSLKAPLIGLGAGAAVLGGFAFYGSGSVCAEGRIVENPAQCRSLVGAQYAALCDRAFSVTPAGEMLGAVDRGVFVTTRKDAQPGVEAIVRMAGDPKWRTSFSSALVEPYRNNCSNSRSGSSTSSGSGGHGSSASSGNAGAHAVAHGGFGSTGLAFFSRAGS